MANQDWDRWIFATMSYVFNTAFTGSYEIFIEGTHKGVPSNTEYLEFRMDGPQRRKVSRGNYILYVEINILVRSYMDDTDFHKMRKSAGKVATWLENNFCIYRYGDGGRDDDTLLGTLQLINRGPKENVRVLHFGQIDPKVPIEEATVQAAFEIHLNEGD